MDTCNRCGSDRLVTTLTPELAHYAKLECGRCGRFLMWLPRPGSAPGEVSAEVLALVHARRRSAPLEGTEGQCRFARSLRSSAVHNFGRMGRPDLVNLVRCVVDATWFLANKGRRLADIRWPRPDQMEPPVSSGKCPNCGDPVYSSQVCSDECADEFSAHLAIESRRD